MEMVLELNEKNIVSIYTLYTTIRTSPIMKHSIIKVSIAGNDQSQAMRIEAIIKRNVFTYSDVAIEPIRIIKF